MSQYPSPYQPPNPYGQGYYQNPYDHLLRPARAAGVVLIVLGILAALMGGGNLLVARMGLNAEQVEQLQRMMPNASMPTQQQILTAAVVYLILGVGLIALGIAVRRGGRGAIITGIVFCGLIGLFALLMMAGGVFICGLVLLVPIGLAMMWLIQAVQVSGQVRMAQNQYQQQYWQYMQQQQQWMRAQWAAQQRPHAPQPPPGQPPVGPPPPSPLPPPEPGDERRPR